MKVQLPLISLNFVNNPNTELFEIREQDIPYRISENVWESLFEVKANLINLTLIH